LNDPLNIRSRGFGISSSHKIAWIISYKNVMREPRVIRQAWALKQSGWEVIVFGLPGTTEPPKEWKLFVPLPERFPKPKSRMAQLWDPITTYGSLLLRITALFFAKYGLSSGLKQFSARIDLAMHPGCRVKYKTILDFYRKTPKLHPELVLCHDYFTANIGYEVALGSGAKFSIDCHEYALGQKVDDPRWVRWIQPRVRALQDYYLPRADAITTVCEGIADLLSHEHALRKSAYVVRSVPFFDEQEFRPVGGSITVLYHGAIAKSRDLDVVVRSLQLWRPEFKLVFRGDGDVTYMTQLNQIAQDLGVSDRFIIEPSALFNQIVTAANNADIGYFIHRDISPQRHFVLPNKFFEYAMAGLALCVSDMPEMARLVKKYDMGVLVKECDENEIAAAINGLSHERINNMKRHAIKAALDLNWEIEQQQMVSIYEGLISK